MAVFLFAATVIAAATGISLLFPGTYLDETWELNKEAYAEFKSLGRAAGLLLLLLGITTATAGRGLLLGARWAWWLAMAVFSINGAGDAVHLVTTGEVLKSASDALIAGTFLFGLLRPNVREFFHKA